MASANDNFGRQHVIPKSKKEKKPNIVIKNNAKLSAASGEELVHENVEAALRRLFSNPTYAPLDPFKCMIFSLRRKERSQGNFIILLQCIIELFIMKIVYYRAVYSENNSAEFDNPAHQLVHDSVGQVRCICGCGI